ncbi:MAG: TetR/AcrR family transcriptional regulator [Terriglobales bacterium]
MAELLHAAGEVFAEVGYENASTNAIAAKAGVSPGTLYQFFPNKQAMAEALANDYAERDKALHESVFEFDPRNLSLREIVRRTVAPFMEFKQDAAAFDALFTGSVVSRELADRVQSLHQSLKQRIARLIRIRCSHMPEDAVLMCAEFSCQIMKGLLPLTRNGNAKQRQAASGELQVVLERYLTGALEAYENKVKDGGKRSAQRKL